MFARLFREEAGPRGDLRPRGAVVLRCVREAVSGRGRPKRRFKALVFARLFREEAGPRGDLRPVLARLFREEAGPRGDFRPWCSRGCFGKRPAQEETSSLGVREAVSGRGRAKRRFKPWCSRGCFGKRPGQEEI